MEMRIPPGMPIAARRCEDVPFHAGMPCIPDQIFLFFMADFHEQYTET
jgi:hypothetical protein